MAKTCQFWSLSLDELVKIQQKLVAAGVAASKMYKLTKAWLDLATEKVVDGGETNWDKAKALTELQLI